MTHEPLYVCFWVSVYGWMCWMFVHATYIYICVCVCVCGPSVEISPLKQHAECVILAEGLIVWMHGHALWNPASERVQINILEDTEGERIMANNPTTATNVYHSADAFKTKHWPRGEWATCYKLYGAPRGGCPSWALEACTSNRPDTNGKGLRNKTHRVGAGEVVSSHDLHVGLLYEGDPQLIPIAGVGAQQLSMTVHWQVVINDDLRKRTIMFTIRGGRVLIIDTYCRYNSMYCTKTTLCRGP